MADNKQNNLAHEITQEMDQDQLEKTMEDDVVIDIEKFIQDTKYEGLVMATQCIYRVPPVIRNPKEAYIPMAVSIGPFHYGDERLQDMEEHKHVLFRRFTQQTKASLDEMVSFVKHLEPKIRASYSENIKLSEKELVKLVLVDAAFIIELFMSEYTGEIQETAKLSQKYLLSTISRDLLLLENQLPFFFLEDLFNVSFTPALSSDVPSFLELTYSFFENYNIQDLKPNHGGVRIKHFTDLLRLFYLPRIQPKRVSFKYGDLLLKYSAKELQEAGVKFKANTSKCLLDLKFSGGVFEIPQILVDDATEILLRNIIGLEQCHDPYEFLITDFVTVLCLLIKTQEDEDVLIRKEIIRNPCGSINVARLFRALKKNTIPREFNPEYSDIFQRLNGFYEHPWRKTKARFRSKYCRTRLQITVCNVATIGLVFTVVQTIISVLQLVLDKR